MLPKLNVNSMKKTYSMIMSTRINIYYQRCIMNFLLEVFIINNDNFYFIFISIFYMFSYKSLYGIAKFNQLKDYYAVLNISKTND